MQGCWLAISVGKKQGRKKGVFILSFELAVLEHQLNQIEICAYEERLRKLPFALRDRTEVLVPLRSDAMYHVIFVEGNELFGKT